MVERRHVLVSAFACRPDRGSEPGVGWSWVKILEQDHDLWVMTTPPEDPLIAQAMEERTSPGVHWIYFNPIGEWRYDDSSRFKALYYYLWQLRGYLEARRLRRSVRIDLSHHVTFCRYWMPSLLALLPEPFVWGPVGGGEDTPRGFERMFERSDRLRERLRSAARTLFQFDPLARLTARRAAVALATTGESAAGMARLGAERPLVLSQLSLSDEEFATLDGPPPPRDVPVRFISIGRLLHWKGFDLGLRAFAAARSLGLDGKYWVVGDGPARRPLETLAAELGIADHVRFWGVVPRSRVLELLGEAHVLVHPSLHESGGMVVLEAMAAGRPVICLDAGGPALLVDEASGVRVPPTDPERAVEAIRLAMERFAADRDAIDAAGRAARSRAAERFSWHAKRRTTRKLYSMALGGSEPADSGADRADAGGGEPD
jgi:glycosyltransferase involved in cell wall biosynthesis